MRWIVTSDLFVLPRGATLSLADARRRGLNIDGLIAGGHLSGPADPGEAPVEVPVAEMRKLTGAEALRVAGHG